MSILSIDEESSWKYQDNYTVGASSSANRPTSLQLRETRCYFCQRFYYLKRCQRLVIKQSSLYITVSLIRLDIQDGVVRPRGENTFNFLRLSNDQQGFYPAADDLVFKCSPAKPSEKTKDCCLASRLEKNRQYQAPLLKNPKKKQETEFGIFETFVVRLAENLNIKSSEIDECIDNVLTSHCELLVDIDLRKLMRASGQSEGEIEKIIVDMFWQPKPLLKSATMIPRQESSKDGDWFRAVDRGRVVPFNSPVNPACFKGPKTTGYLFNRCIHEIEETTVNAFSWYIDEYLYHDFIYPRYTLSYPQYMAYHKNRKIRNPRVTVFDGNPLELDTNFAFVVPLSFLSHHKYVRQYMRDIGLIYESVIRIDKNVPFIVRTLNPITRTHIFHLVFKRSNYSRPSYRHVFKSLVMLRDAMYRLSLKDVAMCKTGCCYERLDFGKILRMTEYVFHDSEINVRIGLNLANCCQLKQQTPMSHERFAESLDLYLDRIDRFFFCDGAITMITGDGFNHQEQEGTTEVQV